MEFIQDFLQDEFLSKTVILTAVTGILLSLRNIPKFLFNGSQLILFEIIAGENIPIGGFINSLYDLAEATNGQLKLKNFKI